MGLPPYSSVVEIDLEEEGDRTRLVLVHRGIPVERIEEHARGWDHFLRLLDAASAA